MALTIEKLTPEHAPAAQKLLIKLFDDMADPAVELWLQRNGLLLAAILTAMASYLPWISWIPLGLAVAALLKVLAWWEMKRYLNASTDVKDLYTYYTKLGHACWVCLDEDGSVVGSIGIMPFQEFDAGEDTAELVNFVVEEGQRGRGIGQKLVAHLEKEAVLMGYRKLLLRTFHVLHSALRFYDKAGYVLEHTKHQQLMRGDVLFYGKNLTD
eukprot:TRINITY_DN17230_c0_g1_i1.p1 TRINITY_DN17230_c0_g1~~TRINITY_DN17230_c0_g1_i1.p1  ORF type:complete len:212 (+),score=38.09 TRINITY_DN17230_c0_g1_i1:241-876(+)